MEKERKICSCGSQEGNGELHIKEWDRLISSQVRGWLDDSIGFLLKNRRERAICDLIKVAGETVDGAEWFVDPIAVDFFSHKQNSIRIHSKLKDLSISVNHTAKTRIVSRNNKKLFVFASGRVLVDPDLVLDIIGA